MTNNETTDESTQTSKDEQSQPPQTVHEVVVGHTHSDKKRRILIGIACVLAVLICATLAWLLFLRDETASQSKTTNSTPVKTASGKQDFMTAPRFSQVMAYASFKGASWYATNGGIIKISKGQQPVYYTQREGLSQGLLTSLIVHKDKLWVGGQHGAAILKTDTSAFEPAPSISEQNNGKLFKDTYADKLYFNDFNALYVFNDANKVWEKVTGPKNLYTFAANKDFIVGSVNGEDMKVWVYAKATNTWSVRKPSGIDKHALQETFAVGDDLFVMGRSSGYTSCEQQGKITASSVYHLDQTGNWRALTDFNKDVARPELVVANHVKDPNTTFYTSGCNGAEGVKYTVRYEDGTLNLKQTGTLRSPGTRGDDGEQEVLVQELRKATGLYPYIRVVEADAKGNLVFAYRTKADSSSATNTEGLAIADGSDFTKSTPVSIENRDNYTTLTPVMCNGKFSYVFAGTYAYGQSGSHSFPNGDWAKSRLLKLEGSKATAFADLQGNVGEPRFACANGKLSWMGKTSVQQLDIASKKISSIGSGLPRATALQAQTVYPVANGDLWALLPVDTSKNDKKASLYHFTASSSELKKIGTYSAVAILGGSTTHAWVAERDGYNEQAGGETFDGLAIYDTAGVKASRQGTYLRVGVTGDNSAIIAQTMANPHRSIIIPSGFITYTVGGNSTTIDPQKVSARSLRLGSDPNGNSSSANNAGVYDAANKRVWFSDDQLGSFAIKL